VTLQVLDGSDVVEDLDKLKLCGGLGRALTNDAGVVVLCAGGILTDDSYGGSRGGKSALGGACAVCWWSFHRFASSAAEEIAEEA
jgi:hypothetical protein